MITGDTIFFQISPAVGLFNGEEVKDLFSSSSAVLEASFKGCCDDNDDAALSIGCILLAAGDVVRDTLSRKESKHTSFKHTTDSE